MSKISCKCSETHEFDGSEADKTFAGIDARSPECVIEIMSILASGATLEPRHRVALIKQCIGQIVANVSSLRSERSEREKMFDRLINMPLVGPGN